MIRVKMKGMVVAEGFDLSAEPPPPPKPKKPEVATSKAARAFLEKLSMKFGREGEGTLMVLLTHSDGKTLVGPTVAEALTQIAETAKGNPIGGPLSPDEVMSILAVRRGGTN